MVPMLADRGLAGLAEATALGRDDAPEPSQGAAAGAERPGGDELLEEELTGAVEAAGEELKGT